MHVHEDHDRISQLVMLEETPTHSVVSTEAFTESAGGTWGPGTVPYTVPPIRSVRHCEGTESVDGRIFYPISNLWLSISRVLKLGESIGLVPYIFKCSIHRCA
jgi:hypothetical protein